MLPSISAVAMTTVSSIADSSTGSLRDVLLGASGRWKFHES